MGACTSAQSVEVKDKNAIKAKATIRQTSHTVTNPEQKMAARHPEARKLGKVKTQCVVHETVPTTVHEHPLHRRRDYLEPWLCSGQQEQNGCHSESPMFQPGMAPKVWMCTDCAYFLCKPCIKVY